jgi:hypothetical protein
MHLLTLCGNAMFCVARADVAQLVEQRFRNSRTSFCACFRRVAPLLTLGNSVIQLSQRVEQNCAVLQPKYFGP